MGCRGVRGAITVDANTREAILAAAKELLREMVQANGIVADEVAFAYFTTTSDLNAAFPAAAARDMGWIEVPLLNGHEMNVPGSLPMCLRILLLVNTDKRPSEIVHIYLKGAQALRPDLAGRK